MNTKLSFITLLRSPFKTLMTFLLLTGISVAFVSRGAEYVTTSNAVSVAEQNYTALGTIRATEKAYSEYPLYDESFNPAYMPLSKDAVRLVRSNGYVASSEVRYVAGGTTAENYENLYEQPLSELANINGQSYADTLRMDAGFVIATCTYLGEEGDRIYADDTPRFMAELTIDEVITGSASQYTIGNKVVIRDVYDRYIPGADDGDYAIDNTEFIRQIQEGHRYFVMLDDGHVAGYKDRNEKYLGSTVDYPLIDLTRLETEYGITDWREAINDPEKYGLIEFKGFIDTSSFPQSPFARIIPTLTYMERLQYNLHTQELVYTGDMADLIKYHEGTMYISAGRAITHEETGNVCVISADYAEKNGLAVGDTIEFTIEADTMMHSGKVFARRLPVIEGYLPVVFFEMQAFSDLGFEPMTATYEIIGFWTDTLKNRSTDPYAYSLNTVFVPEDTYPWSDKVEPRIMSSTFSFVLKHPGDMDNMQREVGEELETLGYELVIDDMGYSEAENSLNMMQASALIGFAVMGVALILALLLITYLFIIRRKKDYAIMRALGTPIQLVNRSLLAGLLVMSAAAVIAGCITAAIMTHNLGADLAAKLSEITGAEAAAMMPVWTIVAFGGGVILLLFVFAQLGLIRVSKKSSLALLQSNK